MLTEAKSAAGDFVRFDERWLERPATACFEEMAARYGDRLAVKGKHHAFTYGELDAAANRIAHALLAALGEGRKPVVLLLENDARAVAAALAAQKARKIAVPADLSYPPDRITFMLADVHSELILTDAVNRPRSRELAGAGCRVLCLDEMNESLPAASPGLPVSPDDLVYIFYTSGSTGRPKGVMLNHRHLTQEARVHINELRLTPADRLGDSHSPGFSAYIRKLYPAILCGASLHVYDVKKEGVAGVAGWLMDEEITTYGMRTVLLDLVDTLTGQEQFPHLRMMTFGGDTIRRNYVDLCRRHLNPRCEVAIGYASTEAGAISMNCIGPEVRLEGDSLPVGRVVEGVEVMLVDEDGAPVAPGQVGEVLVRSPYMSPGYWNRPDLTEAAYAPDPEGGARRVYATGDLGRMRPDGMLEHLGRKDFQVKVRGFRVETGEVEAALAGLEAVKEAVVAAKLDSKSGKRLVAYVVPARAPAPTVSELRRAVGRRLPDYMVPSAFVMMDRLPRTATGKVDRKALPEPSTGRPNLETPYAAPATPFQTAIAGVWREVLWLDEVGVNDDFFDLGGHSLAAAQVLSRVRDAFGVAVPLEEFFGARTVAGLAAALVEHWTGQMDERSLAEALAEAERLTQGGAGTDE
jgi:amino acid adenylation domain-containing protein